MTRVPLTLRVDLEECVALKAQSKVEGRPVNQLLNDAIKSYLNRQGPKERGLEANLAKLRAYRKRDPGFKQAVAAFVEAEASLDDPLEGKPLEGQFLNEQYNPTGPVQTKIREILDA